jgi:hypothetical protein
MPPSVHRSQSTTFERFQSANGGSAGLGPPKLEAPASLASLAAVEALLPPEEVRLLRLSDEGKRLSYELAEMRFHHAAIEDKAGALERELLHLDALITRSAADRAHLEAHGTLPLPSLMPDEAAHAAAAALPSLR